MCNLIAAPLMNSKWCTSSQRATFIMKLTCKIKGDMKLVDDMKMADFDQKRLSASVFSLVWTSTALKRQTKPCMDSKLYQAHSEDKIDELQQKCQLLPRSDTKGRKRLRN